MRERRGLGAICAPKGVEKISQPFWLCRLTGTNIYIALPRRGCRRGHPQYLGRGTSVGISPNIITYFRIVPQNSPNYAISRSQNNNLHLSQTHPLVGRGTPPPHTHPFRRYVPPTLNSRLHHWIYAWTHEVLCLGLLILNVNVTKECAAKMSNLSPYSDVFFQAPNTPKLVFGRGAHDAPRFPSLLGRGTPGYAYVFVLCLFTPTSKFLKFVIIRWAVELTWLMFLKNTETVNSRPT